MGLLNGITHKAYNDTIGNKGNYQFVTLDDIISSFMVVYVGEGKLISKVSRTDIQFHGMRAIQELSYDVLKSHKAYEIEVPPSLVMYLPQDYVNYTKVVRVGSNGVENPLYPTGKTSNPFPIAQNPSGTYQWSNENVLATQLYGGAEAAVNPYTSSTRNNYNTLGSIDGSQASGSEGGRYGLDPQHAQDNGTFYIDSATGFIHFGSSLVGKTITLKYISDGLGTDAEMVVHKFAEEAVYKHIMYGVLSGRSGISENIIARYKKEKFAETRKAKIRLSNIKMEEFTQVLKGLSKPIK
jgi:hypothetical protein